MSAVYKMFFFLNTLLIIIIKKKENVFARKSGKLVVPLHPDLVNEKMTAIS